MSERVETRGARRVPNVLVDATVEADLSAAVNRYWINRGETAPERAERLAKELESAVEEFHEHIRDHRSQDYVRLSVNRIVQDQCSECGAEWEVVRDDGVEYCANCGEQVLTEAPDARA